MIGTSWMLLIVDELFWAAWHFLRDLVDVLGWFLSERNRNFEALFALILCWDWITALFLGLAIYSQLDWPHSWSNFVKVHDHFHLFWNHFWVLCHFRYWLPADPWNILLGYHRWLGCLGSWSSNAIDLLIYFGRSILFVNFCSLSPFKFLLL